jgi:hypothetical protein
MAERKSAVYMAYISLKVQVHSYALMHAPMKLHLKLHFFFLFYLLFIKKYNGMCVKNEEGKKEKKSMERSTFQCTQDKSIFCEVKT